MNIIKKIFIALSLLTSSFLLTQDVEAKDLTGRLGLGFINEFSNSTSLRSIPAVSAKYSITRDIAVLGCFGLNSLDPAGYTVCAKVFKNIFFETNMNFYVSGGFGLIKLDRTAVEILGVFGTEVFIPGIESLGLSFEAGVAATNLSGSFILKTIGYTFLHAGVHFYF